MYNSLQCIQEAATETLTKPTKFKADYLNCLACLPHKLHYRIIILWSELESKNHSQLSELLNNSMSAHWI